jgi:hypothetical protein
MSIFKFNNNDIFSNFPNLLHSGVSLKPKKETNKRTLVIFDTTGSMDSVMCYEKRLRKFDVGKKVLQNLEARGIMIDVLPFNTNPLPLCSVDTIPEPNNCTYFSTIVPELTKIFTENKDKYEAVLFLSDGEPSEDKEIAHNAITDLGRITRENSCNPVSIAIGMDGDGHACAKFAGNRGFETFIRDENTETVQEDIFNGIKCEYEMIPSGDYIPIEKDNSFHYVTKGEVDDSLCSKLTYESTFKFLNLVVLQKMSEPNTDFHKLLEFVNHTALNIEDLNLRQTLLSHFTKLLGTIRTMSEETMGSPSEITNLKYNARLYSSQT